MSLHFGTSCTCLLLLLLLLLLLPLATHFQNSQPRRVISPRLSSTQLEHHLENPFKACTYMAENENPEMWAPLINQGHKNSGLN
jgi:hypothetical protein